MAKYTPLENRIRFAEYIREHILRGFRIQIDESDAKIAEGACKSCKIGQTYGVGIKEMTGDRNIRLYAVCAHCGDVETFYDENDNRDEGW